MVGCVKFGLSSSLKSRDERDFRFISSEANEVINIYLVHILRTLSTFCCVLEDVNPHLGAMKGSIVTLPSSSSLSPIRRKSKASGESATPEKDEKIEDSSRKWNKPMQLLNQNNLGFFFPIPLYMKMFELLKSTYSTCRVRTFNDGFNEIKLYN